MEIVLVFLLISCAFLGNVWFNGFKHFWHKYKLIIKRKPKSANKKTLNVKELKKKLICRWQEMTAYKGMFRLCTITVFMVFSWLLIIIAIFPEWINHVGTVFIISMICLTFIIYYITKKIENTIIGAVCAIFSTMIMTFFLWIVQEYALIFFRNGCILLFTIITVKCSYDWVKKCLNGIVRFHSIRDFLIIFFLSMMVMHIADIILICNHIDEIALAPLKWIAPYLKVFSAFREVDTEAVEFIFTMKQLSVEMSNIFSFDLFIWLIWEVYKTTAATPKLQ